MIDEYTNLNSKKSRKIWDRLSIFLLPFLSLCVVFFCKNKAFYFLKLQCHLNSSKVTVDNHKQDCIKNSKRKIKCF